MKHLLCAAALTAFSLPALAQQATTRPPACQYDRATAVATESIALATMGERDLALLHLSQLDRVAKTLERAGREEAEAPR